MRLDVTSLSQLVMVRKKSIRSPFLWTAEHSQLDLHFHSNLDCRANRLTTHELHSISTLLPFIEYIVVV